MLSSLIAVGLVAFGSLIVGALTARVLGAKAWTWTSAPVGFSVLMIVTAPAAWLPGRMLLPLALLGILVIAGIALAVREPAHRPPWITLPVIAPTLALLSFPFIASGRVGVLGVGFNNDTSAHLWLSEAMHSADVANAAPLLAHYPLGPHGVVGALAALGLPADAALTGFALAVPLLTALTALSFLSAVGWLLRAPIILLTALPYLAASYYGQGAFKESIMVLLLVGFAAALEEARSRDDEHRFLTTGVIFAGIVSSYSYVGLAWPFLALGFIGALWGIQELRAGSFSQLGTGLAGLVYPVTLAGLLTIGLLLPQFPRIQAFYDWNQQFGIKADDIGNLAGPLSRNEILGVWFNGDFRLPPADLTWTHWGALLVGVLVGLAAIWWLWRGLTTVPLVALACLVIAVVAARNQSPYTVAKALVLVSPFVFLLIGRAAAEGAAALPKLPRAGVLAVSALAGGLALWSTALALRSAQVGPKDHAEDLAAIRPMLNGEPTLYLGLNDFLQWELRGVKSAQPLYGAPLFEVRPEKQWAYGQSFDADSVPPAIFDSVTYVVTPHVASDSELPENFTLIGTRGVYDLYRRTGPTQPRSILVEGEEGAARLDCSTPAGRKIAATRGVAAVRGPQVAVPMSQIGPRQTATVELPLTEGTWDLALRYTSSRPITVTAPGLVKELPASLERVGSIWPAGALRVNRSGKIPVVFSPEYRRFSVDAATPILPTELVAQRRSEQQLVPLAKACGQFVDWYRASPPTATGSPAEGRPR